MVGAAYAPQSAELLTFDEVVEAGKEALLDPQAVRSVVEGYGVPDPENQLFGWEATYDLFEQVAQREIASLDRQTQALVAPQGPTLWERICGVADKVADAVGQLPLNPMPAYAQHMRSMMASLAFGVLVYGTADQPTMMLPPKQEPITQNVEVDCPSAGPEKYKIGGTVVELPVIQQCTVDNTTYI